jgi:hypothetical protein
MGKETEFQRKHGMDYPRLCAASHGAEFDTQTTRQNQVSVIKSLTKQLADANDTIRELRKQLKAAGP